MADVVRLKLLKRRHSSSVFPVPVKVAWFDYPPFPWWTTCFIWFNEDVVGNFPKRKHASFVSCCSAFDLDGGNNQIMICDFL